MKLVRNSPLVLAVNVLAKRLLGPLRSAVRMHKHARRFPTVCFSGESTIVGKCKFGNGVRIYGGTSIVESAIGDFSYLGRGTTCQYSTIGRYCSISSEVRIGLGKHPTDRVATHPSFYSGQIAHERGGRSYHLDLTVAEYGRVSIGNDVWIGTRAMIADGVSIGDGAVVGGCAFVTRSIPPYAIAVGIPARVVKFRCSEDDREWLIKLEWWNRDEQWLRRYASEFYSVAALRRAVLRDNQ